MERVLSSCLLGVRGSSVARPGWLQRVLWENEFPSNPPWFNGLHELRFRPESDRALLLRFLGVDLPERSDGDDGAGDDSGIIYPGMLKFPKSFEDPKWAEIEAMLASRTSFEVEASGQARVVHVARSSGVSARRELAFPGLPFPVSDRSTPLSVGPLHLLEKTSATPLWMGARDPRLEACYFSGLTDIGYGQIIRWGSFHDSEWVDHACASIGDADLRTAVMAWKNFDAPLGIEGGEFALRSERRARESIIQNILASWRAGSLSVAEVEAVGDCLGPVWESESVLEMAAQAVVEESVNAALSRIPLGRRPGITSRFKFADEQGREFLRVRPLATVISTARSRILGHRNGDLTGSAGLDLPLLARVAQFTPARLGTLLLHELIHEHLLLSDPELMRARERVRSAPQALFWRIQDSMRFYPLDWLPEADRAALLAWARAKYIDGVHAEYLSWLTSLEFSAGSAADITADPVLVEWRNRLELQAQKEYPGDADGWKKVLKSEMVRDAGGIPKYGLFGLPSIGQALQLARDEYVGKN